MNVNRGIRRREARMQVKNILGSGLKLIEGNDKIRMEKCVAGVNEVLNQFDCAMVPVVTLRPGQMVQGGVEIVAIPRELKIPGNGRSDGS